MPARIPLDVDLEDKLLYGLTPMRLAYLLMALVAAFALWSSHWAPSIVRGPTAAIVAAAGAGAAWGRWRGRGADQWIVDLAVFAVKNHSIEWKVGWFPTPGSKSVEGCPPVDGTTARPEPAAMEEAA